MDATVREARWLVVGLGNPGAEYAGTRHNLGFQVVERLAAEARQAFRPAGPQAEVAPAALQGVPLVLLKPLAYMNLSGPPVAAWLEALSLPAARLVVVHDDLDLPLGRLRVAGGAGAGGHRGVASIQAVLGTQAFPRVRVGIGRPEREQDAADRVLGRFGPEELPAAAAAVERAAGAVRALICEGLAPAMDRYNPRVGSDTDASA